MKVLVSGKKINDCDFRATMADTDSVNLTQFRRWYSTPVTPTVTYATTHAASSKTYALTLTKTKNSVDRQTNIPVSTGLIDRATGEEVVPTTVLELE